MLLKMDSREESGRGYIPHGKTGAVSREQMEGRVERARNKVKETAVKIASGDISINPCITKKYDACRYCEFYSICGERKN